MPFLDLETLASIDRRSSVILNFCVLNIVPFDAMEI